MNGAGENSISTIEPTSVTMSVHIYISLLFTFRKGKPENIDLTWPYGCNLQCGERGGGKKRFAAGNKSHWRCN